MPRRRSQALNLTEIRLRLNENNAGVKRQRVEEHGEAGTLVAREGESHCCWRLRRKCLRAANCYRGIVLLISNASG